MYILFSFLFIFFFYISILIFIKIRIEILEKKIVSLFIKRTCSITSLYEISKDYIIKHKEVFKEYLNLKKIEFSLNSKKNIQFYKIIELESRIHHEINFIFKICNTQQKLLKDWKFLYIRDTLLKKSFNLWKKVKVYKRMVNIFNKLIKIKNITILGLLIPIWTKTKI